MKKLRMRASRGGLVAGGLAKFCPSVVVVAGELAAEVPAGAQSNTGMRKMPITRRISKL